MPAKFSLGLVWGRDEKRSFVWVSGDETKFHSIAIEAAGSRFQTNETPSLNCSMPGSENPARLCTWNGSRSSQSVFRTLWAQVPRSSRNGGSRPGTAAARGTFHSGAIQAGKPDREPGFTECRSTD